MLRTALNGSGLFPVEGFGVSISEI